MGVRFVPRLKISESGQQRRMNTMNSANTSEFRRSGKSASSSSQNSLADLKPSQRTTSPAIAISESDDDGDGDEEIPSSSSSNQKRLHFDNYNLSLDHQDYVDDVSSSSYCPVFLAGGSLLGYDRRSRIWCRIFTSEYLRPAGEFISPRITFEGHMMLLVWKSMSSEGLLTSNGLVVHVTTGENERIECLPHSFLLEESLAEDPGVDPYAIRLIRNRMYCIVMLFVTFFETWTKVKIQGARYTSDGILPYWESRVWVLRADTYETQSSFLARCSAYVNGNLLCLWRAAESCEAGQYHLWRLHVELGVFDVMFIEVPHTWTYNEEDDALIWSPCINSEDQVEVEALECSVLFCASRVLLVLLFRVGPPPDLEEERRTYFATVRIHEVVDFDPSDNNNYPPFVSMSPIMCFKTNEEFEYMSTTFVADQELIYICPNYNSEERARVLAYDVTSREWSLLPPANPRDLEEWECWGETPLSFNPSVL